MNSDTFRNCATLRNSAEIPNGNIRDFNFITGGSILIFVSITSSKSESLGLGLDPRSIQIEVPEPMQGGESRGTTTYAQAWRF
jgi:hypothetical protein